MKPISYLLFTLLSLSLAFPLAAAAHDGHQGGSGHGMSGMHGMKKMSGMQGGDRCRMSHGMKHHSFAAPWSETLSDEQQKQIDQMHLKLARDMAVVKAKADVAQKELNVYTVSGDAKPKKIEALIDQLLTYKKEILKLRYAHLLEMRGILTDEQRISYDMGVIKRSGIK